MHDECKGCRQCLEAERFPDRSETERQVGRGASVRRVRRCDRGVERGRSLALSHPSVLAHASSVVRERNREAGCGELGGRDVAHVAERVAQRDLFNRPGAGFGELWQSRLLGPPTESTTSSERRATASRCRPTGCRSAWHRHLQSRARLAWSRVRRWPSRDRGIAGRCSGCHCQLDAHFLRRLAGWISATLGTLTFCAAQPEHTPSPHDLRDVPTQ